MYQKSGENNREERVAVAIDKDKGSQYALKWAVDHLITRGQSVTLIYVKQKSYYIPTPRKRRKCTSYFCCSRSSSAYGFANAVGSVVGFSDVNEDVARAYKQQLDAYAREVLLPFRCFCGRKAIKCEEIILEDTDISKAIIDYVTVNAFEALVLGASSRNGFVSRKFKGPDVPTTVSKGAPDFCSVYVISKGKILTVRSATLPIPASRTIQPIPAQSQIAYHPNTNDGSFPYNGRPRGERTAFLPQRLNEDMHIVSPFTRGKAANGRVYGRISMPETDISFVSSGRPSTDRMFPSLYDSREFVQAPHLSNGSEIDRISFGSTYSDGRSFDLNSVTDYSQSSNCSGFSASSLNMEEVESEMRRLRLELKQTMDMYNTACKEALTAKQKAKELQTLKIEEDTRLEEARLAEEAALAMAEREKAKCQAALEAAETSQKIAELEAQRRITAEMKALKEAEEKKKALKALSNSDVRYRKYTIEEIKTATDYFSESLKIGEGGYGPVYKCNLDHTQVAIKVLRPDAAQGQSQFQQEVEILSCIRHPNMVILLGACPEYGCLVYEYMSSGSLEDCISRRGNTAPLPWQIRFRIAAEIGTGLLFLHQAKPEPLVHRDLKPANILLDRNYVSKISDVGLARLVPPAVVNSVTQYRMTQTAGTFCYIDPEYQQTGMLGVKSDIYSLGILFLQLITAKPPMGLAHHVERAIERGTFAEFLDPSVRDWPLEDALVFAKIALGCAELRRKDRPDLRTVVLPELNRLRDLAEESMARIVLGSPVGSSPKLAQVLTLQDIIIDPSTDYESSKSQSSSSCTSGRT